MKKTLLFFCLLSFFSIAHAQNIKELPSLQSSLNAVQQTLPLITQSFAVPSLIHDVNSIIKDIEVTIDSLPRKKTTAQQLLVKNFAPLRHFFLTTTNSTSVAAEFLYANTPYTFCTYHDTATALHIYAIKDGDAYNLAKTTDKRIAQLALTRCLLPSLSALAGFSDTSIHYIAITVYYACTDTREGSTSTAPMPYALTLVARMADIQQFASGLLTPKGLLANAQLYTASMEEMHEVRIEP